MLVAVFAVGFNNGAVLEAEAVEAWNTEQRIGNAVIRVGGLGLGWMKIGSYATYETLTVANAVHSAAFSVRYTIVALDTTDVWVDAELTEIDVSLGFPLRAEFIEEIRDEFAGVPGKADIDGIPLRGAIFYPYVAFWITQRGVGMVEPPYSVQANVTSRVGGYAYECYIVSAGKDENNSIQGWFESSTGVLLREQVSATHTPVIRVAGEPSVFKFVTTTTLQDTNIEMPRVQAREDPTPTAPSPSEAQDPRTTEKSVLSPTGPSNTPQAQPAGEHASESYESQRTMPPTKEPSGTPTTTTVAAELRLLDYWYLMLAAALPPAAVAIMRLRVMLRSRRRGKS